MRCRACIHRENDHRGAPGKHSAQQCQPLSVGNQGPGQRQPPAFPFRGPSTLQGECENHTREFQTVLANPKTLSSPLFSSELPRAVKERTPSQSSGTSEGREQGKHIYNTVTGDQFLPKHSLKRKKVTKHLNSQMSKKLNVIFSLIYLRGTVISYVPVYCPKRQQSERARSRELNPHLLCRWQGPKSLTPTVKSPTPTVYTGRKL